MYASSVRRTEADRAALIEALRPVADAVRKKRYETKDGEPKPGHFMIELAIPVRDCQKIMRLVDAADFGRMLKLA
jgi:hypothetical protein